MRYITKHILHIVCLAAVLGGCFLDSGGEEILVLFPPVAPEIVEKFGPPAFRLDCAGAEASARIDAPAGASSVSLKMSPTAAAPLILRLVFNGRDDIFFPAGGLYPHDSDSAGSLRLRWEGGFAAVLLTRLAASGYPVEAFNAGRFLRETELRGAGNPWALDEELIITTLSGISFRADRIKLLPTHPVTLSPLPAGTWLPRNPLARPAETAGDGSCNFGYLAEGYHRYYRREGPGKVDIHVKSRAQILWTVSE